MNAIEQVMVKVSARTKLAAAAVVAALVLVLVLWVSGASIQSLWITPLIIVALWIAIKLGLGYRHRHHAA